MLSALGFSYRLHSKHNMKLTQSHWHFILVKQGLVAVLSNVFINGIIAWLIFKPAKTVSMFGSQSYAVDLTATTFFLTFFISFFAYKATFKEVLEGRLALLAWDLKKRKEYKFATRLVHQFCVKPFLGSIALAVAATLFISPIAIGAFILLDARELPLMHYVVFKAFFAGLLAAIIVLLVSMVALTNNILNVHPD